MSPALYADEEGRATMTRDVGAEDPFVFKPKRNSSGRKGGPLLWLVLATTTTTTTTSVVPFLASVPPPRTRHALMHY
ncbi:hypothetical protein K0M31_016463, partial [Melipona bicolor]